MATLAIVVWLSISLVIVALSLRWAVMAKVFVLCYVLALSPYAEELGERTIKILRTML